MQRRKQKTMPILILQLRVEFPINDEEYDCFTHPEARDAANDIIKEAVMYGDDVIVSGTITEPAMPARPARAAKVTPIKIKRDND